MEGSKTALRDRLLTARRRRPLLERREIADVLAERVAGLAEVRRAASVAAYVSVGSEPGTGPLLWALADAGKRVLLPVLLPDGDLDWAVYPGDAGLVSAARGLLEPVGARLGVEAVTGADAVVVPGLAVSTTGLRLGRGGGSYDRVLARLPPGTFSCVLLHDDEVAIPVPAEPHDRSVTAAVTPTRVVRFG